MQTVLLVVVQGMRGRRAGAWQVVQAWQPHLSRYWVAGQGEEGRAGWASRQRSAAPASWTTISPGGLIPTAAPPHHCSNEIRR